jgi:hypothetical protein
MSTCSSPSFQPPESSPFVQSVCQGIRARVFGHGRTQQETDYPSVHHEEHKGTYSEKDLAFFQDPPGPRAVHGTILGVGGQTLLPGMYSMPIYTVPKPGTTDLRLVHDHSAGRVFP